jgi:PrtD family type I secretion system ABC transporter
MKQRLNTPLNDAFNACKPVLGSVVIFSFFINLLLFVGPMYMLQIYDRVLSSRSEYTLLMLSLVVVMLFMVYGTLEGVRSRILVRTGVKFNNVLAPTLFDTVFKHAIKVSGGAQGQALRDMDTVREVLSGSGILAFCDAPWVPIFLAGCFLIHPWLGYLSLAGAVLIFILAIVNELLTGKKLREGGAQSIVATSYASSTLKNAEVAQAMGMTGAIKDRWATRHGDMLYSQSVASASAGSVLATSKFVRVTVQSAVLGLGAYLALQQEITPGAMIAASIIMGRALAPVEQAVGNWKQFSAARSATQRLQMLFQSIPLDSERMSLPDPEGEINVEGVVAAPPGSQLAVLKGISFSLSASETLAIIGPSAAGKSTLARVLVGVWPVAQGAVRLDGSELKHWNKEQLGKHVGYLPQDVELFAGTIAENISRFSETDDEVVIRAAELAGVHEMIQRLPNGYETEIGEGGQALSGGQRQRIALARALFNEPCFIVLDEPNASLDKAGEEALADALRSLKKMKKTVIVISHKPSLLSLVDKILVMHLGTVQTFGARDDVLKQLTTAKTA